MTIIQRCCKTASVSKYDDSNTDASLKVTSITTLKPIISRYMLNQFVKFSQELSDHSLVFLQTQISNVYITYLMTFKSHLFSQILEIPISYACNKCLKNFFEL